MTYKFKIGDKIVHKKDPEYQYQIVDEKWAKDNWLSGNDKELLITYILKNLETEVITCASVKYVEKNYQSLQPEKDSSMKHKFKIGDIVIWENDLKDIKYKIVDIIKDHRKLVKGNWVDGSKEQTVPPNYYVVANPETNELIFWYSFEYIDKNYQILQPEKDLNMTPKFKIGDIIARKIDFLNQRKVVDIIRESTKQIKGNWIGGSKEALVGPNCYVTKNLSSNELTWDFIENMDKNYKLLQPKKDFSIKHKFQIGDKVVLNCDPESQREIVDIVIDSGKRIKGDWFDGAKKVLVPPKSYVLKNLRTNKLTWNDIYIIDRKYQLLQPENKKMKTKFWVLTTMEEPTEFSTIEELQEFIEKESKVQDMHPADFIEEILVFSSPPLKFDLSFKLELEEK